MMKKFEFDKALIFLIPGFIGFALFYILPFMISLSYSLKSRPVNGSFVGLHNYIELFQNKAYLKGLKNTLFFIGTSVPLNVFLSLSIAILINKVQKYRHIFVLIFLIPLVIPSGSMVFFWKSLFADNGVLNSLLYSLGIEGIQWIESSNAKFVMLTIFIWKNIGYNMVLFLSGLSGIPKSYYEAAEVDGAGPFQMFMYITIPGLLTTLVPVIIMSIINSFKVFKEIYLITGSYPHESIYMLQHFMNNMFNSLNYQKLTTATTILVFLVTLLAQFLLRAERKAANEA